MRSLLVLFLLLAACGEDEAPTPPGGVAGSNNGSGAGNSGAGNSGGAAGLGGAAGGSEPTGGVASGGGGAGGNTGTAGNTGAGPYPETCKAYCAALDAAFKRLGCPETSGYTGQADCVVKYCAATVTLVPACQETAGLYFQCGSTKPDWTCSVVGADPIGCEEEGDALTTCWDDNR